VNTPKIVNMSTRYGNTGADHRPAPRPESGIVYVGRLSTQGGWNMKAHPLENPYLTKIYGLDESLRLYRIHLFSSPELLRIAWDLRNAEALGCWCAPEPCHIEVILEAIALMAAGVIPIPGQ
jgi:hypothetical protein